ncbi:MauE/DoxX family redox-associated membrane protein [Flavobacterium sp. SUN046]|uniref:MauE/DoxX family redox-associated membrane protein n=1 Tax=Flavobacterium sp. SUN046 TaxID=3002440 RepID=UPI002DB80E00|nr:MauE/DoxX family redox-associated membrane protein [Flavobacterium sp. SUN046]MEC4050625.1 MauE/DoxX family redox-associated membrane protein [Flavobacterium sp. SUN046]
MDAKKSKIAWTIRIVVSLLFILSAVAKLSKGHLLDSPYFAISTFEVKQLYPMGFSEAFAPYFSRTLIGIELAMGLLLLQRHWLRKFVIPVTTLLLAVFVGHLTYVTFLSGGNSGNCGCFGELLPMTPIEAIIKNIVAIALLGYLFYILPKVDTRVNNFWVLTTVLFASILSIYMLAPIQPAATTDVVVAPMTETVQDSLLKSSITLPKDTIKGALPVAEVKKDTVQKIAVVENNNEPKKVKSGYASFYPKIDTGKKLLCFFVPGCDHCRAAAKELTEMRKKDANFPPLSIIFMNEEADLIPDFFKDAGANYPYKIIEIIPFWKILGSGKDTPGIKYLWNGNEIKYYWGINENKFVGSDLNTYLHKSYAELKK